MRVLWQIFYNIVVVPIMYLGFRVASLFNPKIQEGFKGREHVFESIQEQLKNARDLPQTAWFHFTSVGEFEQAKPIIREMKDQFRIVLTYFSPSVHEDVMKYPHADVKSYLPFDTMGNAHRMIELLQPSILIFSKFDIWPNYVWTAAGNGVLIVLIAGTLHPKSKRLYPIVRTFLKQVHNCFHLQCAISNFDARRLASISPSDAQIYVTGDTRFDRVYERAKSVSIDEEFIPGQSTLRDKVIIAGSTYHEDETALLNAYSQLNENLSALPHLILVPHEPTSKRIEEIKDELEKRELSYVLFTELEEEANLGKTDVIVIDTIGLLAKLYKLGTFAFVGGSFHGSVHNVMEPAAMAKPVIFGPTIHNSYEAKILSYLQAGIIVKNAKELKYTFFDLLSNPEKVDKLGKIAESVIQKNLGASEKTVEYIRNVISSLRLSDKV